MNVKKFSQEEVNRIVTVRIKRERERLTKEFENKIKRCMASIHLTLYQEMCAMKQDMAAETQDPFDPVIEPKTAAGHARLMTSDRKIKLEGGERQ